MKLGMIVIMAHTVSCMFRMAIKVGKIDIDVQIDSSNLSGIWVISGGNFVIEIK